MPASVAVNAPLGHAIPLGLGVEITVDFYGERVVLLTDHTELYEQVCTCFGRLAYAGGLAPATQQAHIRILTHGREAPRPTLERAWNAFSAGFAAAVADSFLLLHGAAVLPRHVDASGGAVAFLGPSRCGKTTLALAAAALGLAVLGDDLVALEWETGRLFVVPSPLRPRDDSRQAASSYPHVGSPALTVPTDAPVLTHVILLGSTGPNVIATAEESFLPCTLLKALRRRILLNRLLHGLRFARLVCAPALPSVGASLAPQMRLVESLLALEAKA